jgi:hypothetical protein
MSIQLERRIRKIEAVVATRQPEKRPVKIMGSPIDGDADEEARYRAESEQAVRDGFVIIRLVPLKPKSEGDKA